MKRLKLFRGVSLAVMLALVLALAGCSGGSDGAAGAPGASVTGDTGPTGATGATGATGGDPRVAIFHGEPALLQTGEFAGGAKSMANVTITGATADAGGVVTVNFDVTASPTPVTTVASVSAAIFKLAPKGGGLSYNKWVPYIWRTETVSGTADAAGNPFVNPDGTVVNQGYRESSGTGAANGTLVNNGGGSYTYTFKKNLSTATMPDGTTLVGYDQSLTHRVSIYTGGHSGPTGEGDFDFVPAGGAVTQTRNIVKTDTCKNCHGPEFAGHGGDRITVEGCVTCHSPGSYDAQSGESIEMAVMIHKIHAGNELRSVAGLDGAYYDNPWTALDETLDNGKYILWGHSTTPVSWEGAAFPAVLSNCQACHTGSGENVTNWAAVPSRAACGSCHDSIVFATGANHGPGGIGGAQASDDNCTVCHPNTGVGFGQSVTVAHNWTTKDIRNIPEFDITLTASAPANGTHFVNGESPVISIALKDKVTGAVIVPATVIQDPTGEGCIANAAGTACTVPRDGLFTAANVYVTGPRAQRIVNLTYASRAAVRSATVGPWDLSAGGASLRVKVDSGMPMLMYNDASAYEGYGADELISGDITVTLPAAGAALEALFPSGGSVAATPAEVAAWLNANATFKERAIAYVDEALAGHANAGKLAIRSRGVSKKSSSGVVIETTTTRNIQIVSGLAGVFTDTAIKNAGGADSLRKMTTANATNPKGDFTDPTAIKYTLDPVDDLVPGTYMINVEFGDGGRGPNIASGGINPPEPPYVDYRAPSVAVATFQVKQAETEKQVADNCAACHWSDAGVGFVLDAPRHNKLFDTQAVDRCSGCHDYAPSTSMVSTATSQVSFEGALSKRVHAVHNGSALNYPTITVGHEETSAFGRNWRITYPMDIRNCESCHSAATSGTWKTNANRLACMGCHDSDEATAHMKLNTYDPTPLAAWSGDEKESCKSCH